MNIPNMDAWITTPPEWDDVEDDVHYTSECGDCLICGVIE